MSDRSARISELLTSFESRVSYIGAKLSVLVPSQIRALRLRSNMPRQSDLAHEAKMHQSRISMFETPGAANLTLDTLSRLAAAFKVGLKVEFVPFSEMLDWESNYSQDTFNVTRLSQDAEFIRPEKKVRRKRYLARRSDSWAGTAVGRTNIAQPPMAVQATLQFEPPLTERRVAPAIPINADGAFKGLSRIAVGTSIATGGLRVYGG